MFIEEEPGSEADREERFGRADRDKRRHPHGGGAAVPEISSAAPPEPLQSDAVAGDDLEALRAALANERRNRVWLESRLEELDQRLRRAQASERAVQAAATQDQVAALGLQSALTADRQKEADREALESWILEAQIRADAAEPQALVVARQEPIVMLREPVVARETVVVREVYVDPHFEEKIAAARMAVQVAEARAEHNAAQVRRLTDDLAAARSDQMRSMNRLRELDQRLHGVEARADLLDSRVVPRISETGAPELELPVDAVAEAAQNEKQSLSLEDFEPHPARGVELGTSLELEEPAAAARSDENGKSLVDTFTDLFGGDVGAPAAQSAERGEEPLTREPAFETTSPSATPSAASASSLDSIADALELWGSEPLAPAKASVDETAAAESDGEDAFEDLASAFESFGAPPAAESSAMVGPAELEGSESELFFEQEAETISPAGADTALNPEFPEPEVVEVPIKDRSVAPAQAAQAPRAARGETLRRDEVPKNRSGAVADALQAWSTDEDRDSAAATDENGKEAKSAPKGRAAMVDALLRFMGPQ